MTCGGTMTRNQTQKLQTELTQHETQCLNRFGNRDDETRQVLFWSCLQVPKVFAKEENGHG